MNEAAKVATVYRMVMKDHVCPYGIKTVDLLEREGFTVEDNHLATREQTDAFKARHGVDTTPQTFIGGKRIGGYDQVREFFGKSVRTEGQTSYQPVIAIFVPAVPLAARFIAGQTHLDAVRTIPHHEHALLPDSRVAEGDVPRHVLADWPRHRLDELLMLADQRQGCGTHAEHPLRFAGDPVKPLFRGRSEEARLCQ